MPVEGTVDLIVVVELAWVVVGLEIAVLLGVVLMAASTVDNRIGAVGDYGYGVRASIGHEDLALGGVVGCADGIRPY